MRHLAANVLSILIVAGLLLAGVVIYGKHEFSSPGPLGEETVFTVPKGAHMRDISDRLEAEGVIDSALIFRLGARYTGQAQGIRYGEYSVPAGISMEALLDLLESGKTIQHRITVAEGLTSWQVVEILRESDVLDGEIEKVPAEGSLAPNTYFVARGDSREALIDRMQADQKEILAEAWKQRDENLPLDSPEEALILASIVEKETGVPEERRKVASVFLNRLRKGMKLQSDPTIIYGVTEGRATLGRGIRKSELEDKTPYNTYVVEGLPPTPIANPGREAIMAVVNPEDTDFLYFVADGTGGHVFASTLSEHNRNVRRWRSIEREQSKNQKAD